MLRFVSVQVLRMIIEKYSPTKMDNSSVYGILKTGSLVITRKAKTVRFGVYKIKF